MPYVVVNREDSVLSRESPDALLSWIDAGVSRATDYRYAITFETNAGAVKCAGIYGGVAVPTSAVGRSDDTGYGVERDGGACVAIWRRVNDTV